MRCFTGIVTLGLASLASAARLVVSLPSSQLLQNPSTLPSSTHAVLLGPPGIRYESLLRQDNTFLFDDVPAASYLLTLHTRDFAFSPYRVDVVAADNETSHTISAWQTFRGNEWSNKGPEQGSAKDSLTIQVQPNAQKNYYEARAGFNLLNLLKSPMILMGVVSVAMIFGLPYLMDNLDPEMKAEMEEMQKQGSIMGSQGAATQIQNFDLAGWMAGKTAAAGPEAPASPASGGGGGGGPSKRR